MTKQERRLPTALCGRCGTGKLQTGDRAWLNYKSVTGAQVCPDCALDEMIQQYKISERLNFLRDDDAGDPLDYRFD